MGLLLSVGYPGDECRIQNTPVDKRQATWRKCTPIYPHIHSSLSISHLTSGRKQRTAICYDRSSTPLLPHFENPSKADRTLRTPVRCYRFKYLSIATSATKCWVRFQVLMATSMKLTVYWDVAPCSLVESKTDVLDVPAASISGRSPWWWRQ
jgi:hypothetical protein